MGGLLPAAGGGAGWGQVQEMVRMGGLLPGGGGRGGLGSGPGDGAHGVPPYLRTCRYPGRLTGLLRRTQLV